MTALSQIATFLIHSLATLYLLVVILRFIMQLVRADFYNPICQFTVKATNPLLWPLRRVIPGFAGVDLAALVLMLLLQLVAIEVLVLINAGQLLNPLTALLWGALGILGLAVNLYFFGLLILVIVSWVAPHSYNPALVLLQQVMQPVISPFQRVIPPMGGIDISVIFVFLAIQVVKILLHNLNGAAGLVAGVGYLVPGA